jgi:MMP 1-O-methyltransferase
LLVAPGPHGAALARVIEAQGYAIDFEYSGRRNQEPLTRYKEALIRELGPEEGIALYKDMFGPPPDSDEPDAHARVLTEERPTSRDAQAERSAHRIHPVSRELLDIGVQDQEELPDSPSEQLDHWLKMSESIPGTTRGELARELARVSSTLPSDAIIVEIGAFMGSATVLLAGPRQMRGSGRVHVVDPFDCSGDPRSTPIYERVLQAAGGGSLLDHFVENIRRAGLSGWIEMHQGRAPEIAASWTTPVDMIYIDLDVSGEAAGEAYDSWCHFLKPGGIIVVHNSDPEDHRPSENPDRRPIENRLCPPSFTDVRIVDGNTFARKATAKPVP